LRNAVIVARVYELIERLKNWPNVSGAKALRGKLAGKYRIRTGDYRILFHVEKLLGSTKGTEKKVDKSAPIEQYKIVVEKIGHRDKFYDN
jgi:hypothetical protein